MNARMPTENLSYVAGESESRSDYRPMHGTILTAATRINRRRRRDAACMYVYMQDVRLRGGGGSLDARNEAFRRPLGSVTERGQREIADSRCPTFSRCN